MTFDTKNSSKIYKIISKDPEFILSDKFSIAHRAAIEIDQHIPVDYEYVIYKCIEKGWIKPIAYISEQEKIFIGLTQFK